MEIYDEFDCIAIAVDGTVYLTNVDDLPWKEDSLGTGWLLGDLELCCNSDDTTVNSFASELFQRAITGDCYIDIHHRNINHPIVKQLLGMTNHQQQ